MTSPRPNLRYQQVKDQLQRDVLSGKYQPGQRLPSLSELSRSLGVNQLTVRRGLDELVGAGLVEIHPRVGTFVKEPIEPHAQAPPRIVLGLRSYMLKFKVSGHHPGIASYMAALDHKQHQHDFVAQVLFYEKGRIAEKLGDRILREKIDGIILADGDASRADHDFFQTHHIRHVHCGGWLSSYAGFDGAVVRDRVSVLRQVVSHLYELGHRRIALVDYAGGSDREILDETFRRLLFDRRLGDARNLMVSIEEPAGNPRWEQIESVFDIDPPPSAVIVTDEFLADVLLSACDRRGVSVPDELSLAALSDLLPFGHRLPLTAPDSPAVNQHMIEKGVDMVIDLVRGVEGRPRHEQVHQELMPRASTGPYRQPAASPQTR